MKKIVYRRQLNTDEEELARLISGECGVLYETACIMLTRGIDTVEKARAFLTPGKKRFIDPYSLKNLKEAADRIRKAAKEGETVVIFGDYDADGICATAIMYLTLKELGIPAVTAIPEREFGYGLSLDMIEELAGEYFPDLIITVDCGISNAGEVEAIKELGMDIIVTDHHELPDTLPDCITVNPKLQNQEYPYDNLCGAGVAFKLACALLGEKAYSFVDLAALATIADSMALTGENRDIVAEGLKLFNSPALRKAFKILIEGGNSKEINETALAFAVAPRINAAGRMGDVQIALDLLVGDDEAELRDLAGKLTAYNAERQVECENLYKSAKDKLKKKGAFNNIIILSDESWKPGFVGIVASKLAEEYSRPVILFTEKDDGYVKGSVRSIDNINIYDALSSCREHIVEFGGHSQAAGVTVKKSDLEAFERELNSYLDSLFTDELSFSCVNCETPIAAPFDLELAKDLKKLEPFGVGNRRPLYTVECAEADFKPLKQESPHISGKTDFIELLYFNGLRHREIISNPSKKQFVFEPNISVFNKRESLKGYVRDFFLTPEDSPKQRLYIFWNNMDRILSGFEERGEILTGGEFSKALNDSLRRRFGTLILSDGFDTAEKFGLNIQKSLYFSNSGNLANNCVISPSALNDFSEYHTVIYLDKPLAFCETHKSQKVYINGEDISYGYLDSLSTGRSVFSEIYLRIKSLENKPCSSPVDCLLRYCGDFEEYQFLFCLKVFLELNLIKIDNRIIINKNEKTNLEASKIYSKIDKILREYGTEHN